MWVYIVTGGDAGGSDILGVFSSRGQADSFLQQANEETDGYAYISVVPYLIDGENK